MYQIVNLFMFSSSSSSSRLLVFSCGDGCLYVSCLPGDMDDMNMI